MRTTWNYNIGQRETLKLSRSRLEMFLECPRCFWLLMRHNVKQPSIPSFLLNSAVDTLLKKEFDIYRQKDEPHPLMKAQKLKAVPFKHTDLEKWRHPFEGIQYLVEQYNFLIFGGVDDVWINDDQELLIVDYKATAKDEPVVELYPINGYHDSYRRQLEVYQWLFAKNDFKVNPTAYIVYATGLPTKPRFSNKLTFSLNLIPHQGDITWIDTVIDDIYNCLQGNIPALVYSDATPKSGLKTLKCKHCAYIKERIDLSRKLRSKK